MTARAEPRGKDRFVPFLIALSLFFLLYPVMVELEHVRVFRLAFAAIMVFAVYTISGRKHHTLIAALLGGPAMLGQLAAHVVPNRWSLLIGTAFGLAFLVYVTGVILREVLRPGRVTTGKVAGAISVYLLIGLVWALLYGIVAIAYAPEAAFRGPEIPVDSGLGPAVEFTFIYYSFVTLTTLGYGEITPARPIAEGLAWLEAAVGQLYIAVLIARLVALHILDGQSRSPD